MSGDRLADLSEMDRLHAEAELRAEVERLRAELERTRRGAQTLGRVIEQQGRDVLDATGLHDWIDEDGDGDWAAVWENLQELRPALKRAEADRDRLAATVDRVSAVLDPPHLATLDALSDVIAKARAAIEGTDS